MTYSGSGGPSGATIHVSAGDSAATIQSKLDSLPVGGSLVFESGAYDFGGTTIAGKSGVTIWANGAVVINNAPGAGTHGAFDFSGRTDWTIGGTAPGQGFVFNGGLIDASNASHWAIGNATFNEQASNGFDGAAIRMNGAANATIVNNDFNGVGGNVLGMYDLDRITIAGNHFVASFEPISIQGPTTADPNLGHDIVIKDNVFLGTERAAIEIGPASSGAEYFSGLVISNNYFDDFHNTAGDGTLLAISAVGQASDNTTITNNYISRGPNNAGEVGVAVEMTGTGEVSGNTIVNFAFPVLTYQSGWNVHGNAVVNDGSSPYYGFANNGSGDGSFGWQEVVSGSATAPPMPGREAWGNTGDDSAGLDGPARNYTVTVTAGSAAITVQDNVGGHGSRTFTNVHTLQFADQALDTSWFTKTASLGTAEITGLVDLYIASFNRAPDALGLDYWGSRLSDGVSLPAIAASFFVQPEAAAAYPAGQPIERFVTQVYHNVLGRTPDASGLAYWTDHLKSGDVASNSFLLAIINGAQGADVQYLAAKEAVGAHFALTQGLSNVGWAKAVMSGVGGTASSMASANAATDGFADQAASEPSSELIVKILGIVA